MNSLDIKKIIHTSYADFTPVMRDKKAWMNFDYLDRKEIHYIHPHSEDYFSPIGLGTYLTHFKKKEWFNFFPILYIRDGLLPIIHFFYNHRSPEDIETVLILPHEAQSFVPKNWLGQCLFYTLNQYKNNKKDKIENLYLTTSIDESLYNDQSLEDHFSLVNKVLKKNPQIKLNGIFFKNVRLGDEVINNNHFHDYKFYSLINNYFKDKINLISWKQAKSMNYENSLFLELNEFKTLYSDSFVSHHLLSKGSLSLDSRYQQFSFSDDSCLRLSKFHFLKVHHGTKREEAKNSIWNIIDNLPPHVLAKEKLLDRGLKDFEQIHLCTKEFKEIVLDFIQGNSVTSAKDEAI